MALSTVKEMFIAATGRRDLDTTSATGANWYINAGQRYLDSKIDFPKSKARHVVNLPVGGYVVTFPDCRAITNVYIANSNGRVELEAKTELWLVEAYPKFYSSIDTALKPGVLNVASEDLSTPAYYAPIVDRLSPVQNDFTRAASRTFRYGMEGLIPGVSGRYRTVMIAPPTKTAISVEIYGYFFSSELVADTDRSYWTEIYPAALVQAAVAILEAMQGSSDRMQMHFKVALELAGGAAKDAAIESCAGLMEMEG